MMKISTKWLQEYVDLKDQDLVSLAENITRAGVAIEKIEKACEATNLVVGHVLEKSAHPNSDHLNVCKVDLGDSTETIVCGASNVDKGQKVIVATIGAILPGNFEIKKAKIRDIESNGMICSLEELGVKKDLIPEEFKNGIFVLPNDAIIGSDPLTYIGLDDVIYHLDLNPNRNDCLSILGMAYEVASVTNKKVKEPQVVFEEIAEDINNLLAVKNETDNCELYSARMVKNITIKESPEFIKQRLLSCDIRPINNVVDISNYVMLLYGQPLHFFDQAKVGKEIVVRMANDNEETVTLDNIKRTLNKEDIVITNGQDVIALAGVMGSLNSIIDETTKDVIIESAIFNPYKVRYTSIKNNLRSEASLRFEKSLDPNRTQEAIDLAVYLLKKYADASVFKNTISVGNISYEPKHIDVTISKINNVLGMKINENDINDVFNRLQFSYILNKETYTVNVPTRRRDIFIKEDLIEEIGRIYGYDNINACLPIIPIKAGNYNSFRYYIRALRKYLLDFGISEALTYSLVSDKESKMFATKEYSAIEILKPLSEEKKVLRHSLLPSLINVYNYNKARKIENINIFEISTTYYKKEDNYLEGRKLSGLFSGCFINNKWQNNEIKVDFYLIKGLVENMLDYLGLQNRYTFEKDENIPKDYHKGMSSRILVDQKPIGYLGIVSPSLNKDKLVLLELSLDQLLSFKTSDIKYIEPNKYPTIKKDISLLVNKDITADEMIKEMQKTGGQLITDIEVFDLYIGEKIDTDKKSMAFSLTFEDSSRTLTDDEVNKLLSQIILVVENKFEAVLRDK